MSTSNRPELIGISGTFGSGKDTLAHHLVEDFAFTHVSTSDMVREVARRERGSIERPVLHEVATEYRKRHGAGAFVKEALEKPRPLVVTAIRTLGEVKELKAAGGIMVFIDAPVELRYERVKSRQRDLETELTLNQFRANEQKEWYSGDDPADFNLRGIKATSDIVINNTMTLDEFIRTAYQKLSLQRSTG